MRVRLLFPIVLLPLLDNGSRAEDFTSMATGVLDGGAGGAVSSPLGSAGLWLHLRLKPDDPFVRDLVRERVSQTKTEQARAILREHRFTFRSFEPQTLPRDPTWAENPAQNDSWSWALHSFVWSDTLISAFLQTGERAFLEEDRRLIQDWLDDNLRMPPPSSFTWNDHSTALRLVELIAFLEIWRREGDADTVFLGKLSRGIAVHADLLSDPRAYLRRTNHGFDQAFALLLAGLAVPELAGSGEWRRLGAERLSDEVGSGFTPEGVHTENSPEYHFNLTRRLLRIEKLHRAYGVAVGDLRPLIVAALHFAKVLLLPNGRLPLIGDTHAGSSGSLSLPDGIPVRGIDEIRYALTQGRQGARPQEPDLVLPASGYAVLRSHWGDPADFDRSLHLVFKMAALSTFHFHDDVLGFTLYALGERWIEDPGMFGYQYSHPMRKFLVSRSAHNVVTADDAGGASRKPAQVPSTYRTSVLARCLAYCEAEYAVSPEVSHTRSLLLLRPGTLLVRDRLTAQDGKSRTFRQLFHLDREKMVREREDGFLVRSVRPPGEQMVIRSLGRPGGRAAGRYHVRGQVLPDLQGWVSYDLYRFEPADVVGFELQGKSAEFRTLIEFPSLSGEAVLQFNEDRIWDLKRTADLLARDPRCREMPSHP